MLGRGRGGRGCHGIWPVRRDLGIQECITPLGGFGGGEGETLPLDAERRDPGGNPAPALGLITSPGRPGSLASIWGPEEPGLQISWRLEDPRALLSFPARLTHTLGSAAPHNYINGTSLKMLILPLTYFRLRAIVPTSPPRLRGLAHDSHALPGEIAPRIEVKPW